MNVFEFCSIKWELKGPIDSQMLALDGSKAIIIKYSLLLVENKKVKSVPRAETKLLINQRRKKVEVGVKESGTPSFSLA